MTARILNITARKKEMWASIADPSDFDFEPGPAIDPGIVLESPLVTLYSLDHANRRAIFVEHPAGIDLFSFPFMYQAQYEHAVRAIAVEYEDFYRLADSVRVVDSRIVIVHSVGRSGSTLVGKALGAVDGVVGYSEPDIFIQLVAMRCENEAWTEEIGLLMQSALKLFLKGSETMPNPLAWAFKLRSFGIEIGDLLFRYFPGARSIFLYRNAETYCASALRAFLPEDADQEYKQNIQAWLATLVPPIREHFNASSDLLPDVLVALKLWFRTMECYLGYQEAGMEIMAVRYEDIRKDPRLVMKKVIEYCGLPETNLAAVNAVLEKDSQAGSAVSHQALADRHRGLSPEQLIMLAAEFAAHSAIRQPDVVVPGTWLPDEKMQI